MIHDSQESHLDLLEGLVVHDEIKYHGRCIQDQNDHEPVADNLPIGIIDFYPDVVVPEFPHLFINFILLSTPTHNCLHIHPQRNQHLGQTKNKHECCIVHQSSLAKGLQKKSIPEYIPSTLTSTQDQPYHP